MLCSCTNSGPTDGTSPAVNGTSQARAFRRRCSVAETQNANGIHVYDGNQFTPITTSTASRHRGVGPPRNPKDPACACVRIARNRIGQDRESFKQLGRPAAAFALGPRRLGPDGLSMGNRRRTPASPPVPNRVRKPGTAAAAAARPRTGGSTNRYRRPRR